MNQLTPKWLFRFHDLAATVSEWSKDPNRKVGCVIVSEQGQILSTGFNGLPPGVSDTESRLEKPEKYKWMSHAEVNAVAQAAKHGISLQGSTAVVTLFPCCDCAKSLIVSGVKRVFAPEPDFGHPTWGESFAVSRQMFYEAGVEVLHI